APSPGSSSGPEPRVPHPTRGTTATWGRAGQSPLADRASTNRWPGQPPLAPDARASLQSVAFRFHSVSTRGASALEHGPTSSPRRGCARRPREGNDTMATSSDPGSARATAIDTHAHVYPAWYLDRL